MKFYSVRCRLASAEVWVSEMVLSRANDVKEASQNIFNEKDELILLKEVTYENELSEDLLRRARRKDQKVVLEGLDVYFYMLLENNHTVETALSEFSKLTDYKFELIEKRERSRSWFECIFSTCDEEYADNEMTEKVKRRFCFRTGLSYFEKIYTNCQKMTPKRLKDELYKEVGCVEDFNNEVDRMFSQTNMKTRVHGNPVHYLVSTEGFYASRTITSELAKSLVAAGRVDLERVTTVSLVAGEIDFDFNDSRSLNSLYKTAKGGIMILELHMYDVEENAHASAYRHLVTQLCAQIDHFKNEVLTIISLNNEAKTLKNWFYEELSTLTFVEIEEKAMSAEEAKKRLKELAKKHNVRPTKKLLDQVDSDTVILNRVTVKRIFDEWLAHEMKEKYYPAYKSIEMAGGKILSDKSKGTAYEELNSLIGLDSAKTVINDAINYYRVQKVFADRGIAQNNPSMHMVFTGNPGSAKTTVARLFARIMADNGILSSGHLIEVGRSELVGKYVGWTARIVKQKFKEAKGGVLFIDEAYSLVDGSNSFGDEAINTIVQEMENRREDLIVIFAGYPKEMEEFLNKNPGLNSRIAFHIGFDDYDEEELYSITEHMAKKQNIVLDAGVKPKLLKIYKNASMSNDFGNGRFVRNMLERAQMRQASRLVTQNIDSVSNEDLHLLIAADFEPPQSQTSTPIAIGF